MPYTVFVTPTALDDIAAAIEYYNSLAPDLGYRFADMVSDCFILIARLPAASAVRYRNVHCKPLKRFPYLITYTIEEPAHSISILRVFNTYQEPMQ